MLATRLLTVAGAVLVFPLTSAGDTPARGLPVGAWKVEFANGVVEKCRVEKDGTAFVSEPKRRSGGKATAQDGTVVIAFDDDRVERWTPVGRRVVVEHWYPAAQFPSGKPVFGIAVRKRTAVAVRSDVAADRLITGVTKKMGPKGPPFVFKLYATGSGPNEGPNCREGVVPLPSRTLQAKACGYGSGTVLTPSGRPPPAPLRGGSRPGPSSPFLAARAAGSGSASICLRAG